jgi:hypothetical protein
MAVHEGVWWYNFCLPSTGRDKCRMYGHVRHDDDAVMVQRTGHVGYDSPHSIYSIYLIPSRAK